KDERFTALLHHVDVDRLRTAFLSLKKDAAAGVDGVTWKQYDEHLEEHLGALHASLHRGTYRAKPSRRAFIPKPDGRQRPLGIAALEDKIVQRALVEVMNTIYESSVDDSRSSAWNCTPTRHGCWRSGASLGAGGSAGGRHARRSTSTSSG